MGVEQAHSHLFAPHRTPCKPSEQHGKTAAMDIASFKMRAFRIEAPSHFRPTATAKNSYRSVLAGLISTWTTALGATNRLVVVLDGSRFPLKAREHARRGGAAGNREATLRTLAAAIKADGEDKIGEADKLYKELAYPPPPSVDAWLVIVSG